MPTTRLRIASYNIRKAVGLDWKRSPERILNVLQEIDADIVALQEADKRFGSRHSALPIDYLKNNMNYHAVEIDNLEHSIGWHGNTILIKNHLQEVSSRGVTLTGLEPRGAVISKLQIEPQKQLQIIATHLALAGKSRKQQVSQLIDYIEEKDISSDKSFPCIIAGDFNEWRTFGKATKAFGNSINSHSNGDYQNPFKVITPGPSFHTSNPRLPLDRFVIYGDLDIANFGVHNSATAKRASDHLPIFMDVKV